MSNNYIAYDISIVYLMVICFKEKVLIEQVHNNTSYN
jgi:hypothetical protein